MRDRLIELIGEYDGDNDGDFADYLLENGVILPPCKVGDTVYRIVNMSTGNYRKIKKIQYKGHQTGIMKPCEPTIKRFIRCVTVTKNNIIDCCENYGKTVFLTKEETEQALKGGEG